MANKKSKSPFKNIKTKTHTIILDEDITIIHKNKFNIEGLFNSDFSSSLDSNKFDELFN